MQVITVVIPPRSSAKADGEKFTLKLEEVNEDGEDVENSNPPTCQVAIHSPVPHTCISKIVSRLDKALDFDGVNLGLSAWKEQFTSAVDFGEDHDALVIATHFVSLPWKFLFACVPPTQYCGGWLCFCCALIAIGFVTALIGDLASLLGCCLEIPDSITAITIVALGTSLPDAFASRLAAVNEETADAAIGNVTGSNSVNVFLGLGLPWMIAAIFWASEGATEDWKARYPKIAKDYPNGGFAVPAGDLTFSVCVFTFVSLVAFAVIWYRRSKFQAELGGKTGLKTYTAAIFVLLWLYYVCLSSWKSFSPDASHSKSIAAVIAGLLGIWMGLSVISLLLQIGESLRQRKEEEDLDLLEQAAEERKTVNPEEKKTKTLVNVGKEVLAKVRVSRLLSGPTREERLSLEEVPLTISKFKGQLEELEKLAKYLETAPYS